MESDPYYLIKKAKSLAASGMYNEAINYYLKSIQVSPKFAEAHNELGNVYLSMGNIEEALSCYRRATTLKPFYTAAWKNQGAALLVQGIYDEAVKCFNKAVEIEPNNIDTWIVYGSLMLSLNRYREALECFDKALSIQPTSQEALDKKQEAMKQLEMQQLKELRKTKKICLLGNPQVGKTSLIRRYVYGMFVDKYLPTIGAKVTRKVIHPFGVELTLLLWDITGLEDFRTIHPTYYMGANGALVLCDVTRPETAGFMPRWAEAIQKVAGKIPLIFLGNKSDLSGRRMLESELSTISAKFGGTYMYISAKTGENVEKAFQSLAEDMVFK
jgi:small GTP-binding protein